MKKYDIAGSLHLSAGFMITVEAENSKEAIEKAQNIIANKLNGEFVDKDLSLSYNLEIEDGEEWIENGDEEEDEESTI